MSFYGGIVYYPLAVRNIQIGSVTMVFSLGLSDWFQELKGKEVHLKGADEVQKTTGVLLCWYIYV